MLLFPARILSETCPIETQKHCTASEDLNVSLGGHFPVSALGPSDQKAVGALVSV